MTDEESRSVRDQVEAILASREGRGLDIGNPAHLTSLGNSARAVCPDAAEDDLLLVTAMCWLGPQDASLPPAALREHLLNRLRQDAASLQDRVARVMEFTIAYGCGKWRQVQPGSSGWEHRWQGAMRGLARAMEPAVAQANRWLAEHVVGFPQDRHVAHTDISPEDTAVWSDAWLLAIRFVRPEYLLSVEEQETLTLECAWEGTELRIPEQDYQLLIPPGAKAVWTTQKGASELSLPNGQIPFILANTSVFLIARDEDALIKVVANDREQQARLKVEEAVSLGGPAVLTFRECTCGTTHCLERHRLDAWNPLQTVQKTARNDNMDKLDVSLTLWDCVASAVKGPQASLKTGAFVQGMYFPLLAQEGFGQ